MDKNGNIKKIASVAAFLVWSAIILSAFYITQRPLAFQVIAGITATLWSITLTIILLINSAGLGYCTLLRIQPQLHPHERLILGTGFGLGILGLTGFGLGVLGLAGAPILTAILFGITLLVFILKIHEDLKNDLHSLVNALKERSTDVPAWLAPAVGITCLISFLFALLPPADGFDGLLYHLRLPQQLLADGQLLPYNNFPFWFPSLVEGDFIWALGLGSERTTQLIHWSFFMLSLVLVWQWSHQAFGVRTAWWALAIVISMRSLPWIASWAYTDLALAFFGLACLYSLWHWYENREDPWLILSGLFAGMAMGVKYTSFIIPLLCVFLIFFRALTGRRLISSIKFSAPALLVAFPWYARNWLVMGNPFYPFVFGGLYWDAFRTSWYSAIGTGIGWNFREILLLPLTITLGYRDQTFYDGRIGPLFLLLFPITLWVMWIKRSAPARERQALLIINTFTAVSYLFWTFSVIQTISLWQSRLLFPALIAFAIPTALALTHVDSLNLQRFRPAFIVNILLGMVILMTLLDHGLSLITRRPLPYILGIESRDAYFERIQPNYSEAIHLANSTPQNAHIYFLLEPRSYNMPRTVQPDPLNDNLAHDYYLFNTANAIIEDWKLKGYTHVLVYHAGIGFFTEKDKGVYAAQFDEILKELNLEKASKNYSLYSLP